MLPSVQCDLQHTEESCWCWENAKQPWAPRPTATRPQISYLIHFICTSIYTLLSAASSYLRSLRCACCCCRSSVYTAPFPQGPRRAKCSPLHHVKIKPGEQQSPTGQQCVVGISVLCSALRRARTARRKRASANRLEPRFRDFFPPCTFSSFDCAPDRWANTPKRLRPWRVEESPGAEVVAVAPVVEEPYR